MLEKQAISVVQPDKDSFLSQIFVIPKKDVGYRPVVNLKVLNKFITEEHFKMEGFHRAQELDGENRLERCLLSSSSDQGPPEVPLIPIAGAHV